MDPKRAPLAQDSLNLWLRLTWLMGAPPLRKRALWAVFLSPQSAYGLSYAVSRSVRATHPESLARISTVVNVTGARDGSTRSMVEANGVRGGGGNGCALSMPVAECPHTQWPSLTMIATMRAWMLHLMFVCSNDDVSFVFLSHSYT